MFSPNRYNGIDLLNLPTIGRFIKNKKFLIAIRLFSLILLISLIAYGFSLPDRNENLVTNGLAWGLFWPFFIITSLVMIGPVFCMVCPLGFIGEYLTWFGLKRKPGPWKNYYIGILTLIFSYWVVYYTLDGFYEEPVHAAWFFLVFLLLSGLFFLVYSEMTFCKYICPVSAIIRAFGRVGPTWLTTDKSNCNECKTFDCAKACSYKLQPYHFDKNGSMSDCTLCMGCAQACDSVQWKLTVPSVTLWKKIPKPRSIDVWVYILMLGVITITMRFHHGLGRSKISDQFIWSKTAVSVQNMFGIEHDLTGFFALIYALILLLSVTLGGFYLAARILRTDYKNVFHTLGYALAPLMIVGGLSHLGESFFLHYYNEITNAFIQLFHLPFEEARPLASRKDSWLHLFRLFTYVAIIWSFVLMIVRLRFIESSNVQKILAFPFAWGAGWVMLFLTLYVPYILSTYGIAGGHH